MNKLKLKLDPDQLLVESFVTHAVPGHRGTVAAHTGEMCGPTLPSDSATGGVDTCQTCAGVLTCETGYGWSCAATCGEGQTAGCSAYCQGASAFPCDSADTCFGRETCSLAGETCGGGECKYGLTIH